MLRILAVYPKQEYEHKMDVGRILHLKALARRSDVDLLWWGAGWTFYDESRSLMSNILSGNLGANVRRINAAKNVSAEWDREWRPDVVYLFKPDYQTGVADCPYLKAVAFNDCYAPERQREIKDNQIDLLICHHENDLRRFPSDEFPDLKIVHIPHSADKRIFCRDEYGKRPIDCIVPGVIDETIYPLRARWAELIDSGRLPGKIRRHPGYELPSIAACLDECQRYAVDLMHTKIVLTDTSVYRYVLAKIPEAMAAGCLVVTDEPDDGHFLSTLGRHVVTVPLAISDDDLVMLVRQMLDDPDEIRTKALAGQRQYLKTHTCEAYAEQFVQATRELIANQTN
jgi:hypothetical protein